MVDYLSPFATFHNALNPTPTEEDAYFAAIGRVITNYATAEHGAHTLARRLSRLTDAKARIIFGGMKLPDLITRIRGLLKVTGASKTKIENIEACLSQLEIIAEQRNKLAHRWVSYFEGYIWVSNVAIAKAADSTEISSFGMQDFKNIDSDCVAIAFRLMAHGKKKSDPGTMKWSMQPWRYKPVPPDTPQKRRLKALQSQTPQRLSSRQRREAAMKNGGR